MADSFYPKVDTDFLINNVIDSGKIISDSQTRIGSTITFVIDGQQALHKRIILVREIDGEVSFEQASTLAIRFGFMGKLLVWLEVNKDYKEGGYIVADKKD